MWLDGAPSADEMCEWLKDESFHEKVKNIAYNRPVNSCLSEYHW